MRTSKDFLDIIDDTISAGVQKNLLHLYNDDKLLSGNTISFRERSLVNFGSCSYLGLEFDHRLKNAAKEAVDKFGTQFSLSRAYVSLSLYEQLEKLFKKIFEATCVIAPTTTLAHLANLPVLIDDKDAVIIDQQVHNSVQMAISTVKARGSYTEVIPHNRLDLIEERVRELVKKYSKVWYLADGIYSMYGDTCDVDEITRLMNTYENFYCYLDDAHGMSIYGKNGRGYVLNRNLLHDKMIVTTSLAKAFATGGGVTIYPSNETARRVRTCGGPLITSGPLQPANLGAAIASANIHLSSEIVSMQEDLFNKIHFADKLISQYQLPVISRKQSAIFFVGAGLPKLGYNLVSRMIKAGQYVNLGIFPAVPLKNTGVRFTITRLHSYTQIEKMISIMQEEFHVAMREEKMCMQQIQDAFNIGDNKAADNKSKYIPVHQPKQMELFHYKSIQGIDREDWDKLFGDKGNYDYDGLVLLESVFSNNKEPENNWLFDYIIIRDMRGSIVVATFLTTAIWKDDMLAEPHVSSVVEMLRVNDPYYLTSEVLSTGSLLSEGEHVFIDRNFSHWKEATELLLERIIQLQKENKGDNIILRDFQNIDPELDEIFKEYGFLRTLMPSTHIVDTPNWLSEEDYYNSLSKRSRQHFREDVRKHKEKYEIKIMQHFPDKEVKYAYQLYLNVKAHSLDLNTFVLPEKLFHQIAANAKWEMITLWLNATVITDYKFPVAIVLCYRSQDTYTALIMGLNYDYNKEYKVYRQALYRIVMRANELKARRLYLGFAASVEKKKVGAKSVTTYAYMQYNNSYNMEVLSNLKTNPHKLVS